MSVIRASVSTIAGYIVDCVPSFADINFESTGTGSLLYKVISNVLYKYSKLGPSTSRINFDVFKTCNFPSRVQLGRRLQIFSLFIE